MRWSSLVQLFLVVSSVCLSVLLYFPLTVLSVGLICLCSRAPYLFASALYPSLFLDFVSGSSPLRLSVYLQRVRALTKMAKRPSMLDADMLSPAQHALFQVGTT